MEAPAVVREPYVTLPRIGAGMVVRAADAVALTLLLWLMVRLWFDPTTFFDSIGAIVAVAGLTAALAARARLRTFLDWPLLAYAVLAELSVAVSRGGFATASPGSPAWHPAVHIAVLVAYFYSATWILRTRRRIAVVMTMVVVAVSLVGAQAAYDHTYAGFGTRLIGYTSTGPWLGYPDLGMLFALALPVPLALLVVARAKRVVWAAMFMTIMLWLDEVWLYSRSGAFSALAAVVAVAAIERVRLKRARLIGVSIALVLIFAVGSATSATLTRLVQTLGDRSIYSARLGIWQRTIASIVDHPWLGVGPGNYTSVMRSGYPMPLRSDEDDLHAHNMLLHVAAESGIPAALAFFLIWLKLFRRLWLAATSPGPARAVTIGVFGALVAFFVRCLTDHFMSGLVISDRVSFLFWTLMAAGVAATRLSDGTAAAPRRSG